MANVAVLTNDLQHDLVNKNEERVKAVQAATAEFAGFLAAMREKGCPVIHLQLVNKEDDPNAERYNGYLPVAKGPSGRRFYLSFLPQTILLWKRTKTADSMKLNSTQNLKN